MNLSRVNLHRLPPDVQAPGYALRPEQVGIVHIGVGNFHRSHQAMYVDRFLARHPASDWAIAGIGVRQEDAAIATGLGSQDCLYSLSLFHPDGRVSTRVIGSIAEYVFCPEEPARALARLADPATKIVSLTVTESGYPEDPSNGRTVTNDLALMADIAGGLQQPRSAFGLIVGALAIRREQDIPPFTVASCDNVQHNGQVARGSVLAAARLFDEDLAEWIDEHVAFPSSMVDRITPRPTPAQLAAVGETLGLHDSVPVVAEPFEQWVIEDNFPTGRPALEEVGVTFVESVAAYEAMKLRLLNGAHQLLAYLGIMAGHTYAHEAMADPDIAATVSRYSHEVALPTLHLPEGMDGEAYIAALRERFLSAAMADTLERLGTDSVSRMAKFVLPALVDARLQPTYLQIVPPILAAWFEVIRRTESRLILSDMPDELLAASRSGCLPSEALRNAQWFEPLRADHELLAAVDEAFAELKDAHGC